MEIIHRLDRRGDDIALFVHRNGDGDVQALDHGVEIVDIDLQRLAGGELGAGLQDAGVGPAGEIAEHREAEGGAWRGPLGFADPAETDVVLHYWNPIWFGSERRRMRRGG